MLLGFDFDNTIVCYDKAFAFLAQEIIRLPSEVPLTKNGLRDFLRAEGREQDWTAFQGELYGPGLRHALPFEGAIVTMQQLIAAGHELVIISHRSRKPYAGQPYDLHLAALNWVAAHLQNIGLFCDRGDHSSVHFLETRDQKLAKVCELNCYAFLDDLPEVLTATNFPLDTYAILFNPSQQHQISKQFNNTTISAWCQLQPLIDALSL